MAYEIEFFRMTAGGPHEEVLGVRLQGFSSRRAARTVAERHSPAEADGFRLYEDGQLLIIVKLPREAQGGRRPSGSA